MRIARRYAVEGASPYSGIEFRTAKSEIRDLDGSAVFALDGIEVASSRRQVAIDVLAKFLRSVEADGDWDLTARVTGKAGCLGRNHRDSRPPGLPFALAMAVQVRVCDARHCASRTCANFRHARTIG